MPLLSGRVKSARSLQLRRTTRRGMRVSTNNWTRACAITAAPFQKRLPVEPRKSDDSVGEEVSAFGERTKGAIKDAAGAVTGNKSLEREGERENAEGRARQATNNVMDETDGVRGATAGGRGGSTAGGYVTGLYSTARVGEQGLPGPDHPPRLPVGRHQRADDRRHAQASLR